MKGRPRADWKYYEYRNDPSAMEGRIYQGLRKLIELRKNHAVFASGILETIEAGNEHVLGYLRLHENQRAAVFCNFSEAEQMIPAKVLQQYHLADKKQLHGSGKISPHGDLLLRPLDFVVFG